MVLSLKQTQSNIPQSSSSSCTEFISEIRCGSNRCPKCCISSAINDHTYEVLKKICKKIIRDLNRKQCRENYSVFDGGNSIKVRIQRGQDIDENSDRIKKLGEKGLKIDGRQGKERDIGDSDGVGSKRERAQSKNRRAFRVEGDDSNPDKIKASKTRAAKSKKNIDLDEDDYDPHSKKSKGKGSKPGEDLERDKAMSKGRGKGEGWREDDDDEVRQGKKGKRKPRGDDDDEIQQGKKGKGKRKSDDDYDDAESKKSNTKKDKSKSKEKRRSLDDADNDDSYNQRRGSKNKKKSKKGARKEDDDDDMEAKKGTPRKKKSSDIPIITDLRSKVRKGQEVSPDAKQSVGKKSKIDKERLALLDKELTHLKKKQQTARQLLTDQQENARGRKKSGKKSSRNKGHKSSSRQFGSRSVHGLVSEARFSSRLSRGDQIRPCDVLRANMEQRDLCRLCDQICIPKQLPCRDQINNRTCARNACSELIQSGFCPPMSCFKRIY